MADIAKWMRDVDNQLRKLATAARANKTDVRNGFTSWKTSTGDSPRVTIGADAEDDDVAIWCYPSGAGGGNMYFGTSDSGASAQFRVSNPDGGDRVLNVYRGRMYNPLIATAWQQHTNVIIDNRGRPTTTSGTYDTLWRAFLPCTSGGIFTQVDVFPGIGQTCDVRIAARQAGTVDSFVQVADVTGLTSTGALAGAWAIPDSVVSPARSPIGVLLELVVQVRRTAGSDPIAVAPYPVTNWVVIP